MGTLEGGHRPCFPRGPEAIPAPKVLLGLCSWAHGSWMSVTHPPLCARPVDMIHSRKKVEFCPAVQMRKWLREVESWIQGHTAQEDRFAFPLQSQLHHLNICLPGRPSLAGPLGLEQGPALCLLPSASTALISAFRSRFTSGVCCGGLASQKGRRRGVCGALGCDRCEVHGVRPPGSPRV